jgi:hypothetical protein
VIILDFDFGRLRRSDRIVGGGAIALFVFLFFFKWFGLSNSVGGIEKKGRGWYPKGD